MKILSPREALRAISDWLSSEPDRLFLETVTKLRKDHAQTILSKKLEAIALSCSIQQHEQQYALLLLAEAGRGLDGENGRWLFSTGPDSLHEPFPPVSGFDQLSPDRTRRG